MPSLMIFTASGMMKRETEMLHIIERIAETAKAAALLTLPFEQRQKSRQRVRLDDGREAEILLPRGTMLRHGDHLRTREGVLIRVVAAPETVSTAFSADAGLLLRAAYHLGNRHVPVQIGAGWLRYLGDHVLDDMLRQLGLDVVVEAAPFQPEGGAYHHEH